MTTPLELGLLALAEAHQRQLQARDASRDAALAYASAVEAVWWVCALDERLGGGNDIRHATTYELERDVHPDGASIRGLRWVRDRHTHQMLLTTEYDQKYPTFPTPGADHDYVLYISAGFIWRDGSELETERAAGLATGHKQGRKANEGLAAYERHVAGRSSWGPVAQALAWLTVMVRARPDC